jgi:hypothetical protein
MCNRTPAVFVLALLASACGRPEAFGDDKTMLAVMSPELWEDVSRDVERVIRPTIRSVRSEKTFTVTHQDPQAPEWADQRGFHMLLVAGTAEDVVVQEVAARAPEPLSGPGLYRIPDVWSSGQIVALALLPPEGGAKQLRAHLGQINVIMDEKFRLAVRDRMFEVGADTTGAKELMAAAGFELTVPANFKLQQNDSIYLWRADDPNVQELIRQVAVTWRSPVPPGLEAEDILQWRSDVQADFSGPQDVNLADSNAGPFDHRGRMAYQIQARWRSGRRSGPFSTRAVICPEQDRMYLVDSWLYAPDQDKYEYLIQLETILQSFRCGAK